jgi:carbon catabolite-derepressing protein kinase
MLIVDPLKRATIADIRSDPWFNTSLPSCLKPAIDHVASGVEDADHGIMAELLACNGKHFHT